MSSQTPSNSIIYSVEVAILKEHEDSWVDYMKEHLREIINSVYFKDFNIRKVITGEFNEQAIDHDYETYILEYHAHDRSHLSRYFDNFATKLQKEHSEIFKNKFKASRKIMEDQFNVWCEPVDLSTVPSSGWLKTIPSAE